MAEKYLGADKRKDQRRKSNDRRNEVRYETKKTGDRRETYGRRKQDQTWRLPKNK